MQLLLLHVLQLSWLHAIHTVLSVDKYVVDGHTHIELDSTNVCLHYEHVPGGEHALQLGTLHTT